MADSNAQFLPPETFFLPDPLFLPDQPFPSPVAPFPPPMAFIGEAGPVPPLVDQQPSGDESGNGIASLLTANDDPPAAGLFPVPGVENGGGQVTSSIGSDTLVPYGSMSDALFASDYLNHVLEPTHG